MTAQNKLRNKFRNALIVLAAMAAAFLAIVSIHLTRVARHVAGAGRRVNLHSKFGFLRRS